MTTQSLRSMANAGPMHWRGDRNGKTNQDTGACDTSGDPLAEYHFDPVRPLKPREVGHARSPLTCYRRALAAIA